MSDEAAVFFDEGQACALNRKKLGERSEAWADFYDVVAWLNVEQRHNRSGKILIVEEILPKAAGGVGFQFRKQSLDVAQCHIGCVVIFRVIHKGDVNNPLG